MRLTCIQLWNHQKYSSFANLNKSFIFNRYSTSWWHFIHSFYTYSCCSVVLHIILLHCYFLMYLNCVIPFNTLPIMQSSTPTPLSEWNFSDVLFRRNLFLFEQPLLCFMVCWIHYLPLNLQASPLLVDHKKRGRERVWPTFCTHFKAQHTVCI